MYISFHGEPEVGTHAAEVTQLGETHPAEDTSFLTAVSATVSTSPLEGGWQFTPAFQTKFTADVQPHRYIEILAFRATDVDEIIRFEERITKRYTDLCAEFGEQYAGAGLAPYLGPDWLLEMSVFSSDDPAVVDAMFEHVEPGPELQAIIDECRDLQHRETIRYMIKLIPRRGSKASS